jgi:DNA-binding winged helix-turn-helix (wHTH) protein
LKDGQHGHQYIRTHWGRGYWFEPRNGDEISKEHKIQMSGDGT